VGKGGIIMHGRILLLVAGIIMVVFGAIGLFASTLLVGLSASTGGGVIDSLLGGILVVVAIVMIVIGILGIIYRKRPDKAKLLMVIGIILIVLEAISLAQTALAGSNPVSAIGGIVLGALYFFGALLNHRA
jgi:hypothetical protein